MSVPPSCELDDLAEENRFVYTVNEELLSLQEMASRQVAHAIWNAYISRCSNNKCNKWEISLCSSPSFVLLLSLYSTYREDTNTLVETLKTPRSISTAIKTSLENVLKEMEQFVCCFFPPNRCSLITTFKSHWCVWLPNGKIDYLKTAEIMVSPENDELDLKEKFSIMCLFFMEEKLKRFPFNSLPADFIKNEFHHRPISYWIKYLTGKCKEITAYHMVTSCKFNDYVASFQINHFWHHLSDSDQVKAVYKIIVDRRYVYPEKWQAVEPLFGSMSWDQQRCLLSMAKVVERIIIFSCLYSSSSKCAVWVWKHCRDIITREEFCTILRNMFSVFVDRKKDVIPTVVELWDATYDHHRNILVNEFPKLFRFILHRGRGSINVGNYYTSATYILLNKCLALKSMNGRKTVIMQFAIDLATGTLDPCYIQEMLDLNLPNLDDQIEFKKTVMNSEKMLLHCTRLWVNGNFDILNASIEYYCRDDLNSIQHYNQKLWSYIAPRNPETYYSDRSVITDGDKWLKCCEFINKILPDDPAKALVAKQQIVSQFLRGRSPLKSLRKHFDMAIKTIESVFLTKAELNCVKTKFIEGHLNPNDFWKHKDFCDDVYFHCMIEWCCDNNEAAVVELKNKIPNHDTIFNIVFFQLNKVYVTEATGLKISLLTHLDKYLSWYLASEDEIMAYKMHRLNESNKLQIFISIFEQNDDQSLKILLEWFFDGDQGKIRDFRTKKIKF